MGPHVVPGVARPWLRLGLLNRWAWVALWLVVVLALAVRAARLPELPGSYPEDLDELLYGGARLLRDKLLHADFVTGQGAITQFLYALSALAGSLRLHSFLLACLPLSILASLAIFVAFEHIADYVELLPYVGHSVTNF